MNTRRNQTMHNKHPPSWDTLMTCLISFPCSEFVYSWIHFELHAFLLWQMELVDICFTLSPLACATFRMCKRRRINWLLSLLITVIDPYHPLAVENINGFQSSQPNGTRFLLRRRRCDILNITVSSADDPLYICLRWPCSQNNRGGLAWEHVAQPQHHMVWSWLETLSARSIASVWDIISVTASVAHGRCTTSDPRTTPPPHSPSVRHPTYSPRALFSLAARSVSQPTVRCAMAVVRWSHK